MDAKDKLLDAAERCLMEKGSHATSVKAIAAMAGVNHGLIHHYFDSKEDFFVELVKKHFKETDPPFTLKSEGDVIDYLKNTVVFNSKMIIELRALSYHMPELKNTLIIILNERRNRIQNLLQIERNKTALLMATVSGLGFQSGLDPSMDIEEYLRMILRQLNIRV